MRKKTTFNFYRIFFKFIIITNHHASIDCSTCEGEISSPRDDIRSTYEEMHGDNHRFTKNTTLNMVGASEIMSFGKQNVSKIQLHFSQRLKFEKLLKKSYIILACDWPCECNKNNYNNDNCLLSPKANPPFNFNVPPRYLTVKNSLKGNKLTNSFLKYSGSNSLEKLFLSNIQLAEIEENAFKWVPGITFLDISSNKLRDFPSKTLPKLKEIIVSNNDGLKEMTNTGLLSVHTWRMSNCRSLRPSKMFRQKPSETRLIDISYNSWQIEEYILIFQIVSEGGEIIATNIPLLNKCECEIYILIYIAKNKNIMVTNECFHSDFICRARFHEYPKIEPDRNGNLNIEVSIQAYPYNGASWYVKPRQSENLVYLNVDNSKFYPYNESLAIYKVKNGKINDGREIIALNEAIIIRIFYEGGVSYDDLRIDLTSFDPCSWPCRCDRSKKGICIIEKSYKYNLTRLDSRIKSLIFNDIHLNSEEFSGSLYYNGSESLETLEVNKCSLKYFTFNAFESFRNLKNLILKNNQFTSLPILRTKLRLIKIDLSGNSLTQFDGKQNYLEFIEELYLSSNSIQHLTNLNSMKLKKFDISRNPINVKTFTEEMKKFNKNLLVIAMNAFKCNCSLLPLVRHIKKVITIVMITHCYNSSSSEYNSCKLESFEHSIIRYLQTIEAKCSAYSEPLPVITWTYRLRTKSENNVDKKFITTLNNLETGLAQSTVKMNFSEEIDEISCYLVSGGQNISKKFQTKGLPVVNTTDPPEITNKGKSSHKHTILLIGFGILTVAVLVIIIVFIIIRLKSLSRAGNKIFSHSPRPRRKMFDLESRHTILDTNL